MSSENAKFGDAVAATVTRNAGGTDFFGLQGVYTAGGKILVVSQVPIGDTVTNTSYVSFNPVTWTSANFSANGALIYNSTTGSAVAVLDFGGTKVPNAAGEFTVTFPTATATTAILSIS